MVVAILNNFAMKIILFALGFVPARILAHDDELEFCYDDPHCGPGSSAWGNVCSAKKSGYQSPINFDTATITYTRSQQALQLNGAYASNASFLLHNTGHTVTITPVDTSHRYGCGDLLRSNCYTFAHVHFHWGSDDSKGSEHWIDGRQFPMEAHFVHYKSDYVSFKDALENSSDPTALAVFGVLYEMERFRKLTRRNSRNETVPLLDNFRPPLQQNNRVVECLPAFVAAADAVIY